jgi:hypothetical protein
MKNKFIEILLVVSIVLLGVLVGVYGFLNDFVFTELLDLFIDIPTMILAYFTEFFSTFNLAGGRNIAVVAVTATGILLGLFTLVRGFVARRPLAGLIAAMAVTVFLAGGISILIVDADFFGGVSLLNFLIDGFSSDLVGTLFLAGTLLLLLDILFLIFILGFTAKKQIKVKKAKKIPLSPAVQPNPSTGWSNIEAAPSTPPSSDGLSELVKVVMQEELNMMRNTQQVYPNNQGFNSTSTSNPYASNLDIQLVRRVVAEEFAKLQGQFVTRQDMQTLIAQEILMIKSQLKIK